MKAFLKGVWAFCSYLFWPQRRPKAEEELYEPLEVVLAPDEEYVAPPAPAEGYVRLVSPFSQEMYRDVPLEAFCEVDIQTKDLSESNHFLLSLWNEMNQVLHPEKCDYVPWHYRPDIVATGQNWKLLMLGDVHTSSSNFHILLRMKSKECIKSILAYNTSVTKQNCQHLFEELVGKAKANIDKLQSYSSSVKLSCKNGEIDSCGIYSGRNFYLYADGKGVCIDIRVMAIDYIEAKQQIGKRLEELCSFLSVETNLLFKVEDDVEINEEDANLPLSAKQEYIKPYIDGPSIRKRVLLLSESGVKFIDQHIFVDRDIDEDDVVMFFKRGCAHIYEGLQRQLENNVLVGYTTRTQSFVLSPKDILRSQHVVTMSAMSYLSALETASTPEGNPETCPECGNLKYKIGARVESLVSKYINPEMGREYKELYNLRSKFLHAGKLSCDKYYITARPFIDPSTGSGLSDYGFISCKVKGRLMVAGLHNIQELSTYVLRCYYQESLFGEKDFEPHDNHGNDIDVKQMIIKGFQKMMPDGIVVEDVTTL